MIFAKNGFFAKQDISVENLLAELAIFRAFNKKMSQKFFQIITDVVKVVQVFQSLDLNPVENLWCLG